MKFSPKLVTSIATLILICMVLFTAKPAEGFIGIAWGRQASQRVIPSIVVEMLLQNGIHEAKIFSPSKNVMAAFSNSPIRLSITLSNVRLYTINSIPAAGEWVQKWVVNFLANNVDIRYIHVGAQPFSRTFNDKTYDEAVDVMKLIQIALNDAGYANVKATIPHYSDVLKHDIMKPSAGDFRDDVKDKMVDYVKFLRENNAPAFLEIYPIHYCQQRGLDLEFAFFDNKSPFVIRDDNGLTYTNVFDFLYDSFHWAMKKAGVDDVKLVVGQIGWPTDGYPNANCTNARRFYKGLLPHVSGNEGTPMRPGMPIDAYLHSLMDENRLNPRLGGFQRHWGIFNSDGVPKFKIDFSGKGRNIFPVAAKGVTRMPKRWCILDDTKTLSIGSVKQEVDLACSYADCTSLEPGGSCSHLDFKQNVSYVFNRYFQMRQQKVDKQACHFRGFGKVVTEDPSIGTCKFPIEILQAEHVEINKLFLDANGVDGPQGICLLPVLLTLFSIFFVNINLQFYT